MTVELNSPTGIELRARNCLESVALFTDKQLIELSSETTDAHIRHHLLGEMLVRTWLYKRDTSDFQQSIHTLATNLGMTALIARFQKSIRPLRDKSPPIDENLIHTSFAVEEVLPSNEEECWTFVKHRISGFLVCDGIIPATIAGKAIAIPFTIRWDHDKGKILDAQNKPIDGWISESQELYKTLGRRFGVRLGCAFGDRAAFRNGKPLASGGSFALPILFGATRAKDKSIHPLDVICTGEVLNNELREIGGRDEKHQLAKDIGARLFAAPGIGKPWFLSPGLNIKQAVVAILKECGLAEADITEHIGDVFVEQESGPFTRAIQELSTHFVGRDTQIDQVFDWIEASATSGAKRLMWIGGKAGCGKSAFMVGLMQSPKSAGLVSVPYLFDPKWSPKNRWQNDFFKYAADCIASEYQVDLALVRFEKPEDQFRFALANLPASELPRLLFLLDGVDEIEGSLDGIASVATEYSRCVWVFAGQESDTTETLRNIPSIKHFPLGGLHQEAMVQMINVAAENMPAQLVTAIVENADGFPQYTKLMLDDWKRRGNALDPSKLPHGLSESYKEIVERLRTGGDFTQQWRADIGHILSLLATARHRTPLSAASIAAMLTRYVRPYLEDEIKVALDVCSSILRSLRSENDNEKREWTFSHNSFRQYFLENQSTLAMRNQAREAWAKVCRAWDSQPLEDGLHAYALEFLVEELMEAGDHATVIDLARQQRFLNAQSFRLGPSFALKTMESAIAFALSTGNLAAAASLTLARARRSEDAYSESPFAAMRRKNHPWALELIDRIENQTDRTLWHLALAAFQANNRRLHFSAKVLDEAIPHDALCEKLVRGASMCAVVLLSLLTDVRTRKFQWYRFISRLDDSSKFEIVPLMFDFIKSPIHMIWKVIASISDPDLRINAYSYVIHELAVSNVKYAERQLDRFENATDRASGAVEIVAAFARLNQWKEAKRVMAAYIPSHFARQRAKALAYFAVELKHTGLNKEAANAYDDAINTIQTNLATKPGQQAIAYSEFAFIHAEARFIQPAIRAFQSAVRVATELHGSHILQAQCFATIAANLSSATEFSPDFFRIMERVVLLAKRELDAAIDHKVDPTRSQLVGALGKNGHFELAHSILDTIEDKDLLIEATGRLCSYYVRFNLSTPSKLIRRIDQKSGRDGELLLHSLVALEKVKINRFEALSDICHCLRPPKPSWKIKHWGAARILSEASVVLSRHGDTRAGKLLECAIDALNPISEREAGRYYVDLAMRSLDSGDRERAVHLFSIARRYLPKKTEKEYKTSGEVRLIAEIESAERRWQVDGQHNGITAFQYVRGLGDGRDTLIDKIELYIELITPLAEAGCREELEEVCAFGFIKLQDSRFVQKPLKRGELAGAFAAKLSKSALYMDGFQQWTLRFVEICEEIQAEYQFRLPENAIRAQALIKVADGEFTEAIAAAQRIGVGETRSIVLRDLAIRAVRKGDCNQALHLATRITHGRSQHLPDIGREIVERGTQEDVPYLHRLVVSCSDYSDAAYRIISSIIRFHKPRPDLVMDVLRGCGIDFSESLHGPNESRALQLNQS
jgi:hypothetical protein